MSIDARVRSGAVIFGDWEIDIPIGQGSNGRTVVYRLKRVRGGRTEYSALKAIPLTEEYGVWDALSPEQQNSYGETLFEKTKKAKSEITAMAGLRGDPNIVHYLDHTFIDWTSENQFGRDLYIQMELLTDLRSEIKQNKNFSEDEIIKIGCDICKALIRCHSNGIIHRDIKPDNIFRDREGNFKLGDFGISKSLADPVHGYAGTGVGTFAYLPAEQLKGRYNKLVDIYSLGLVLYELSNGNMLPFAASRYTADQEVVKRLSGEPLPRPSNASPELSKVILKACSFHPKDRYASAGEFLAALEGITEVKAPPKRPAPFIAALTVCAVIAAFSFSVIRNIPSARFCSHTWIPADCTTPQTCSRCGATTGEALGHQWTEATCTTIKSCEVCGVLSGTPLGHQWQEATYDTPKTCLVCGATEGTPLAKPSVSVNDILAFGSYEQDGLRSNGAEPIEWKVLDVQEDKALLLSCRALDSVPYHDSYGTVTWETSSLRTWLNDSFLNTAFTAEERERILTGEIDNGVSQGNREWHTSGGNNTEDTVFLLSYAETERYFDSPEDRICTPTSYAVNQGADTRLLDDGVTEAGWWWLRSPGQTGTQASFVNFDGTRYTNSVGNEYLSVRPALWIRLEEN